MEVVKKNIKLKDVPKVMREVGYNKTSVENKGGSNIEDQLAKANESAKSAPTMADAINRAVANVSPPVDAPVKTPVKTPVKSKSKVVEKVKEKPKVVLKKEQPSIAKKVTIDMTTLKTKVTFVGEGWKPLDIKIANNELIKAFRIKIRDEYRRGIK